MTRNTYTITAATEDEKTSGTVQITASGQSKSLSLAYVHIYGVSWDGFSTTKLTRTDDAGLFTDPIPARSGIAAGAEYWQADFALQLTWWFLYIVEYADWNGQTAIGQGVVSASAKINTGGTDSMVYHTGRAAGTGGQAAVQYRNIENPWGNVREWRDGIIFSDTNICTYNNPANFSDSYAGMGSTTRSNKRAASSGRIKAWGYDSNDPSFIYPSEVGGSGTECGMEKFTLVAKARGIWVEDDAHVPEVGDACVYDRDDNGVGDCTGSADHIGLQWDNLHCYGGQHVRRRGT